MKKPTKATINLAAAKAAAAKLVWRRRCTEAMARHTAATLRQIALHAVTVDRDEGNAG